MIQHICIMLIHIWMIWLIFRHIWHIFVHIWLYLMSRCLQGSRSGCWRCDGVMMDGGVSDVWWNCVVMDVLLVCWWWCDVLLMLEDDVVSVIHIWRMMMSDVGGWWSWKVDGQDDLGLCILQFTFFLNDVRGVRPICTYLTYIWWYLADIWPIWPIFVESLSKMCVLSSYMHWGTHSFSYWSAWPVIGRCKGDGLRCCVHVVCDRC